MWAFIQEGGAGTESGNRNLRGDYLTRDYRGCGGGGLVLWDLGRMCRLRGDYAGSGGGGLILWNLGCSRGLHRDVFFTRMSWVLELGLRQFRTLVMLSLEAFYGLLHVGVERPDLHWPDQLLGGFCIRHIPWSQSNHLRRDRHSPGVRDGHGGDGGFYGLTIVAITSNMFCKVIGCAAPPFALR